jgi:hypothetical protein
MSFSVSKTHRPTVSIASRALLPTGGVKLTFITQLYNMLDEILLPERKVRGPRMLAVVAFKSLLKIIF